MSGMVGGTDIIFETAVLEKLLKSPADIAIVVDLSWYEDQHAGKRAMPLTLRMSS